MSYFTERMSQGRGTVEEQISRLKSELEAAEVVVIGAGAGLSTSAGFTYSGERFEKYFFDFAREYKISDMYSGGFYHFPDSETKWGWWARNIYFNRYVEPQLPVYKDLLALVEDKDYFVLTTNVDHQFQRAGFDKKRLFYTQGDFGLFQSVNPVVQKTYDNEEWVMKAMEAQGFVRNGSDMTTNLRVDSFFVEDAGWHRACKAYNDFLDSHKGRHILYLELGVGANTPVIIKYPFWQLVKNNNKAVYACINYGEAFCPKEIEDRSICIDGDIGAIFKKCV